MVIIITIFFNCQLCTSHINILLYLIFYTAVVLGTLAGLRPTDDSVFLDVDLTNTPISHFGKVNYFKCVALRKMTKP